MEIAEQDGCFGAGDDKDDEHKEEEAKHVVHLVWPEKEKSWCTC